MHDGDDDCALRRLVYRRYGKFAFQKFKIARALPIGQMMISGAYVQFERIQNRSDVRPVSEQNLELCPVAFRTLRSVGTVGK